MVRICGLARPSAHTGAPPWLKGPVAPIVSTLGGLQKKKLAENETTTGVKPWENSDIMQALAEIGDFDGGAISESTEDEGNDIAYDSVYDDQRFGFGADFIKATLGAAKGGVQPKAEYDLDAMVFSCGDIEGEADC